jgi:hypothetical protein
MMPAARSADRGFWFATYLRLGSLCALVVLVYLVVEALEGLE